MDFFEHQDKARRNTRYLILLFVAATLGIVLAVDIAAGVVFGVMDQEAGAAAFTGAWFAANAGLFTATSLGTVSFIGLSSAYRIASLSAGGGNVARGLGGVQVSPDTRDPLRRRLHNVVEEIAIASGVPVPEVYVLEKEDGINAFAAGFSTSDAVVAVTRGTLENLDRDELQGVIAHEFSHILNGDMRLNMRLMGLVFGILALGIIGRTVLRATRHVRVRSDSGRGGAAVAGIVAMGVVLLVVGYVGVFFGRLIKAAVSRQREYLADASAVQFTRQTDGIAGALKKIAALTRGSLIREADSEEVGHMLFATGSSLAALWATHPPLEARIRSLDPGFKHDELAAIAATLHAERARELESEPEPEPARPQRRPGIFPGAVTVTPEAITRSVGNPGLEHVMQAALLHASLPDELMAGAHNPAQAVPLMVALLLDPRTEIQTRQLALIDNHLGPGAGAAARTWHARVRGLDSACRLPLLEILFPTLKTRPRPEIESLNQLCEALVQADGIVDTFEFTLLGVLRTHLEDAAAPAATARGKARLSHLHAPIATVFAILARSGHQSPQVARAAWVRGLEQLSKADATISGALESGRFARYEPETAGALEPALRSLDRLVPADKQALLAAMVATVTHDDTLTVAEAELLRAICAMLHLPLPPIIPQAGSADD